MAQSREGLLRKLAQVVSEQQSESACSSANWYQLLQLAQAHGLAEWFCLRSQQMGQTIPAHIRESTDVILQTARVQTALRQRAWQLALQTLQIAGIEVLSLKGIVLAHTVYPAPFLRPMVDLDLLVADHQREQAVAQLTRAGFRLQDDAPDMLFSQFWLLEQGLTHHYVLRHDALRTTLELHFRLLTAHHPQLAAQQMSYFWQHRVPLLPDDPRQTLEPELHALYLCAHAIFQHGEHDFRLLRYLDLHLLVSDQGFDWERFLQHAEKLNWSYAALRALTLATDYFGTTVPDQLRTSLQSIATPPETSSQPREQFMLTSIRQRARGLPLHQQLRLFLSILIPPPTYMRERYRVPANSSILPYYWYRLQAGIVTLYRRVFPAKS